MEGRWEEGGKEGHLTVRVDKERVSMTEMPSMAPVTGEEGVVGVSMTIQVWSRGGVGGSLEMLSTKEVDNPIQLSSCHHNSAVGRYNLVSLWSTDRSATTYVHSSRRRQKVLHSSLFNMRPMRVLNFSSKRALII